ncbi:MAG: WYL domain-containing protein [Alcaligenaceae bacterium]|nr:MAG: WYL domain-containing protein [Alcaligenaceae bacterium]
MTLTKPARQGHERLAHRLTEILVKLNRGEQLEPRALADEFGVDLRTVQRDLNQRFAYLDLVKEQGRYRMNSAVLGRLSTKDIERFALASGTAGLFPTLSHAFVRELLRVDQESPLLVKGHHFEDVAQHAATFAVLSKAIIDRRHVRFDFSGKANGPTKAYDDVAPYRMLNHKGVWYLAAAHQGRLKTFGFSRVRDVLVKATTFEPSPDLQQRLEADDSLWQSQKALRVVLDVAAPAAHYFQRRNLVANQVIETVDDDGSLRLVATVGHPNEILPIIRYWIPHLRIVEPAQLQVDLEAELARYILQSPEANARSP